MRQPYELPDFYVPSTPRLNPHLESARRNSKAWAIEMGFVGGKQGEQGAGIWDEHKLDTMDFALLCAYTWPDAPGPELDLLTEWMIWGFYVDDDFIKTYKDPRDLAGAKEYVARLLAFMPANPADMPEPTNLLERGLANLWPRIMHTMSADWQQRFLTDTQDTISEPLWELSRLCQGRTVDPVDYIGSRRKDGGALWAADMVEHSAAAEVPARIVPTRPMQVLRDTFADAEHLLNDIFSYQREVEEEGTTTNSVLLVERLLGCTPQQAANLVNDLLNSRLHQFENTVVTELPPLFEEYGLSPAERLDVLRYARGLQDWYSGSYEWHKQSSRYMKPTPHTGRPPARRFAGPTGLGTSAAHIALWSSLAQLAGDGTRHRDVPPLRAAGSRESAEQLELPAFYMPFRPKLNPRVDAVRAEAKEWADRMGMLDWPRGLLSGLSVWDEPRFDRMDLGLFTALVHPDTSGPRLTLANHWYIWAFYFDDFFVEVFKRSRNLPGAKAYVRRLSAFLPPDPATVPAPRDPVERGLADLWARTAPTMSAEMRRRFPGSVEDFFSSSLWELANLVQGRMPDPVDYIEMRRKSIGTEFDSTLAQYGTGEQIPAGFSSSRSMRALIDTFTDVAALHNDIFSYRKEIEDEGDITNGVLVVQRFLGCDLPRAVGLVRDLAAARLREFEQVVAVELPALFEELDLSAEVRQSVCRSVEALQQWLAGSQEWSTVTGRYRGNGAGRPDLGRLLAGPVGLGTSAARLPVTRF